MPVEPGTDLRNVHDNDKVKSLLEMKVWRSKHCLGQIKSCQKIKGHMERHKLISLFAIKGVSLDVKVEETN
jgi:hypothetical protein